MTGTCMPNIITKGQMAATTTMVGTPMVLFIHRMALPTQLMISLQIGPKTQKVSGIMIKVVSIGTPMVRMKSGTTFLTHLCT